MDKPGRWTRGRGTCRAKRGKKENGVTYKDTRFTLLKGGSVLGHGFTSGRRHLFFFGGGLGRNLIKDKGSK